MTHTERDFLNTGMVITALVKAGASRPDAASAVFGAQADGAGTVEYNGTAFRYDGTGPTGWTAVASEPPPAPTATEPLSDFWRENARQLIDTRHCEWQDPSQVAAWVGRASAVLAEALRASGDDYGIVAILGAFHETKASTEIKANADE